MSDPSSSSRSNKAARHDRILALLQAKGSCTYAELQETLGVSSMTARRDVATLAARGVLIKTLGGAQQASLPPFLHESAISSRFDLNRAEKDQIASAALGLVTSQQWIYLDGSTTCLAFARRLARSGLALHVLTNSAMVAMELGASAALKVTSPGGEYDAQSGCFVGALAEETVARFAVDVMFMSTKAFQPADGTYESGMGTLRVKQIIAKRAGRRVLLVDSTKFGLRALCKVIDVATLDVVITDEKCSKAHLRALRRGGVEVIVAPGADVAR